jgi:predicted kinase
MGEASPVVYLLCGLPGTGKTFWAKDLERRTGLVRLSLDEAVLDRLRGKRDPNDDHRTSRTDLDEATGVVEEAQEAALREAIANGRGVILDHGLWRRADRDWKKQLVADCGGTWQLMYFTTEDDTQWKRLEARNRGDLRKAHFISAAELGTFRSIFEIPEDEGETVVRT